MGFWSPFLFLLALGFASFPFLSNYRLHQWRFVSTGKTAWMRLLEFGVLYALFIVLGSMVEAHLGQNADKDWVFYVVILLLFVVAAFPAFVWRYFWK